MTAWTRAAPRGEALGRGQGDGWPGFAPYRWRDPARCSSERLAELAARDAVAGERSEAQRRAEYRRLRASGVRQAKAAAAVGLSRWTARRWEQAREKK